MNEMIHIKAVSTPEEFNDAMSVRNAVFVQECGIEAQKEFDGNDFGASHILAYVDSKPAGTIRVRYFSDFVKLERCCVDKNFRKTNLSEELMSYTYKFCAQKGYRYALGSCKKELLAHWQKDGFYPIKGLPEFMQNNMTLIPIIKKLEHPRELNLSRISFDELNEKDDFLLPPFSCRLVKKGQQIATFKKNNGYDLK